MAWSLRTEQTATLAAEKVPSRLTLVAWGLEFVTNIAHFWQKAPNAWVSFTVTQQEPMPSHTSRAERLLAHPTVGLTL
jgi:hypothetical protein